MKIILTGLVLMGLLPGQQVTGQDLDALLVKADKIMEEAKSFYEEGRSKSAVASFVEAGFKLEEARIKYLVLQELGAADKQAVAAERLRSINQLSKLIHDGRVAISGTPASRPSEIEEAPAPKDAPAPSPLETIKDPADVMKRAPVPDAGRLKDAEKLVKDLFKDQYAKKTPADRKLLAKALLAQVTKNREDLTAVWVLCREAQDAAIQGGDITLAVTAIDTAALVFDVDVLSLRNAAIGAASKTAKAPEEIAGIVLASIRLIEDLIAADQFDTAEKLAASSVTLAKKSNNTYLAGQATARGKDLAEAKQMYLGMKNTLQVLAKFPDDQAGNLEMGKFLCFIKGNWDMGLRFIVKGSDATLKALAEKELANAENSVERAAVADGWRELADKEKSSLRKSQLLAHSIALYEDALAGASGLLKSKIEKILEADAAARAKEAGAAGAAKGVNLLSLIDPKEDAVLGTWQFEGRVLLGPNTKQARIQVPYIPPDEYDLHLEVERLQAGSFVIGLVSTGNQFNITCDSWGGETSGLDLLDGKSANANESMIRRVLFPGGKVTLAVVSVRKDGIQLVVDGVKAMDWKGSARRLTLWEGWKMNRSDVLFIGSHGGPFRLRKISIVEVTGKGRRLR